MAVERPTFSESWYRVADLHPRLRATVQVYRQHFRGQMWHVLQDPAANQFYRLNEPAYHFVGLLDGRRSVADAWRLSNQQLGDAAPTQGEAIQLLGQLYASNLLMADLPADASGLFKRFQKRRAREVQGYLTNLLFVRIPLFDPNRFLDKFVNIFGLAFSWFGLVVWMVLVGLGLNAVLSASTKSLTDPASNILDPANLPLLYVSFILIKIFHEFGHAFACKWFGRRAGGGEVHVLGVMLLIFTPMPYVDASSSWAFRRKWHRAIVGAAGMYIELAVAAVAAVIWSKTAPGTPVHALSYNAMFLASVSTLLFNANPLLRYDGYYILSDLLEIPNLAQRSKDHIYYLVKRYVWGVKKARQVAHTLGEKFWFVFYGVASTVYRVFVLAAILMFVSKKMFIVGALLAAAALVAWLGVPLGKFLKYLATDGELMRVRGRAVATTLVVVAGIIALIGMTPMPDRYRIEGTIDSAQQRMILARAEGFVTDVLPTGQEVDAEALLVRCENKDLESLLGQLAAKQQELASRRDLALSKQETAKAQALKEQLDALAVEKKYVQQRLSELQIASPQAGQWVSMHIDRLVGAHVKTGDELGMVADLENLVIRAAVSQTQAAVLSEGFERAEVRIKNRPDLKVGARITYRPHMSQRELPSESLGYPAGGSIRTAADDRQGTRAAETIFEVLLTPDRPYAIDDEGRQVPLLPGENVIVRFEMPPKPWALQWWRTILQLLQSHGST